MTLGALLARATRLPLSQPSTTGVGCLRWTQGTSGGYGIAKHQGKPQRAHRLVCELVHRRAPQGHVARHSVDCRLDRGGAGKLCVEPTHLRWGTKAENAADEARFAASSALLAHGRNPNERASR